MNALVSLLAFLLMATRIVAAPEVVFTAEGRSVRLSTEDRDRIVAKIEAIVRSASINSRDHAPVFAQADETYWRPLKVIRGGSHLRLSYPTAQRFETIGGTISATEVWVDLQSQARADRGAVYPGPITLASEGGAIRLTKESGYLVLGFGLDPAIHPHLPKVIQESVGRMRAASGEIQQGNGG